MTWKIKTHIGVALSLCASIILLNSCYLGDQVYSNSYILGYYDYQEISVSSSEYTSSDGIEYFRLTIKPESQCLISSVFHDFPSDNGQYDEYCRIHHDTSYHRRIVHSYNDAAECNCYPASDLTSISLTCIDAWDKNHKANSSLGDISTFVAISVWPFIDSGYTEYDYDAKQPAELFNAVYPFKKGHGKMQLYPICKKIDEINADDLKLLGEGTMEIGEIGVYHQLCDIFIPKRENSSPCTLKLTMTNTDGKTYSREVVVQ